MKRLPFYLFILCIALASFAEIQEHLAETDKAEIVHKAQGHLQKLETQMQSSLDEVLHLNSDKEFHEYFLHHGIQSMGFSFFYYENEKLTMWSDNEVEITFSLAGSIKNPLLLHLNNGWYEAVARSAGAKKIIGLLLIKKEYSYENKYLQNHFNAQLQLPANTDIDESGSASYSLQSISGEKLISLRFLPEAGEQNIFSNGAWMELIAYLLLLGAVLLYFIQRTLYGFITVALAVIALMALRLWMIVQHMPNEFYDSDFFSPKYYGSSFFFNSPGDLLLNALTFFCIAYLFYSYAKKNSERIAEGIFQWIILAAILTGYLLLGSVVANLISGFVINSKIAFDVNTVLNFNGYSLGAIIAIMLLLWSYFFLLYALLIPFRNLFNKRNAFFISAIASLIIAGGFILLNLKQNTLMPFAPLAFAFLLILSVAHMLNRKIELSGNVGIAFVFLFALYTSVTVHYFQAQKEKEERKLFAQRLDFRQDHLAEFLFADEEKKLSNDIILRKIFLQNRNVTEEVTKHLQQFYFSGYLTKFDITPILYDKNGIPFDLHSGSLGEFEHEIETQSKPTFSDKLFFMVNESGILTYLAELPVKDYKDTTQQAATLVLRFKARVMEPADGFPELLVSNKIEGPEEGAEYSFARYKNNSLIYVVGNFPYSFSPSLFNQSKSDFTFITNQNFEHLVYRPSAESLIVVSKPVASSFAWISQFSYMLFFFSTLFFASRLIILLVQDKVHYPVSLKQRIRSSILGLVLLSFVLIAAGTIYYISHKYNEDLDNNILSRLNSLWFSLSDLKIDSLPSSDKERLQPILGDLSNNLNLDYNLYDESGNLFYSSQPKIFEKGLISSRMNPEALFEMKESERTQFVQPENIGKLSFIAGYSPLTDRSGNIAGYVNLPFLERQNELNKEISGFLSALITIYMLLLALAVVIALFISSRITKPLLLIQEKLGNIALGQNNESIEWDRKDEIGELVREYNRMIGELAVSAEKLSRSERESAWREMAKQVAHEIKNPLTPMKLHLQHLQRSLSDRPEEELRAAIDRTSKILIEQIDTLNRIASEFSNFATMPRSQNEVLNLGDVISSAKNLFTATPGITITFHNDDLERKVFSDRQQIIRAFSNLIKNAIQAIPEDREGKIDIEIGTKNNFHVVSISDNGTGIAEEQRSKIFTPSFTTKTSGTGLGLAIVKNSMEQIGGRVWFETKEGAGTTFFVELPTVAQ
jgi:two-component system nitrogen regulation sensor histidine kinase NtrY